MKNDMLVVGDNSIELRFEASKGRRMHRYFLGVTLTEITEDNLWWNTSINKWEPCGTHKGHSYSTHAPCKTLKAFKRMLRKYPEIVGRCVLVNRYKDSDIYA